VLAHGWFSQMFSAVAERVASRQSETNAVCKQMPHNNGMQRTALRAAADAERYTPTGLTTRLRYNYTVGMLRAWVS